LGLLWEDEHEFELWTYVDQGVAGTVTITPSLTLNGLVAEGYGMGALLDIVEEPIAFVSNTTIEWTYDFTIQDGFSIDITTSSSDISDIDLYLFWWNGSGWEQRGASTTGSSDEYVGVINPDDGEWRIGINNWSGPAGHFNLNMEVVQGTGISVEGTTTDPIPANTGYELTINYDYPMEADHDYYGLVILGPPEAPTLKRIPIYLHRLQSSTHIDKGVDHEVSFPKNELEYEIPIMNLSDPDADFEFIDVIPAGTAYVDHWTEWLSCPVTLEPASSQNGNGCPVTIDYEPGNNRLYYNGPLPLATGGESVELLWDMVVDEVWDTFEYREVVLDLSAYDDQAIQLAWQYVGLDGNSFGLDDVSLPAGIAEGFEGGVMPPLGWDVDHLGGTANEWGIIDAATYPAFVRTGDYAGWVNYDSFAESDEWLYTPVFTPTASSNTATFWALSNTVYPSATMKVWAIVPGEGELQPAAIVHLTVLIDEEMEYPECILNEATLQATHYLPQETQVEPLFTAEAETCIGESIFGDSHKKAPAEAELGDIIEYQIVVENTGDELVEVTLVDPIPEGTAYVSHDTSPPYQHFSYNAGEDQMEWTGNVAPAERLDFTFEVELVDTQLWGEWLENTATITWDTGEMDLFAETWVLPAKIIFHLPQIHCLNE
jgi:uncharacterized repeat protein (TIGR01451 family)